MLVRQKCFPSPKLGAKSPPIVWVMCRSMTPKATQDNSCSVAARSRSIWLYAACSMRPADLAIILNYWSRHRPIQFPSRWQNGSQQPIIIYMYMYVYETDRGVNPRGWGSRHPRFWAGVTGGSWNIIISYHVQEVCSKMVTFEDK